MKHDEQIAFKHLCQRFGPERVVYEPDGNVPPDFIVRDGPAVEVRRLNLHDFNRTPPKAMEEKSIPLWSSAEKFLATFGPPQNQSSWFLILDFDSVPKNWPAVRKRLRQHLQTFLQSPRTEPLEWNVDDNLRVQLIESTTPQKGVLCLGAANVGSRAYWVVHELKQAIEHCASEKLKKIERYRSRYGSWWLLFIDHIAFGPSNDNLEQLRECLDLPEDWDKIVLVGGREAERAAEI